MKQLAHRHKTVLVALAASGGEMRSRQLAIALGYDPSASTMASLLFSLRKFGLTESPVHGVHRITAAGLAAISPKPSPTAMAIDVATPDLDPVAAATPIQASVEQLVRQISGALASQIAEQTMAELRRLLQVPHVRTPPAAIATDDVSSLLAKVLATSRDDDDQPPADHLSSRVAGQVTRLPIITLVGLLPGQAKMIANEYGQRLHLRFVGNEHQQTKRLEQLCQTSYAVIVMTGFVSHSTFDTAKAASKNLCAVKGGMSSVRMHLDAILTATDQKEAA
jgi:hypothetical protein